MTEFCARPKTTKRYVHPPMAERMFTLWAEGKLLFGDVQVDLRECNIQPEKYFDHYVGCALWPVYGEELRQFDFRTVKNVITEDGAPIHGLVFSMEHMEASMEVFCNTARKATLFGRLSVKNTGTRHLTENVSLLVRTARECDLVYGKCDGYVSYAPDVQVMKDAPSTWSGGNGRFTDGERVLTVRGNTQWDPRNGAITLPVRLAPGETAQWLFSLDKGEVTDFDYAAEKNACAAFWRKELQRIKTLPKTLMDDPETMKMARHMTAQLLQMFAVCQGTDVVIPRQGGLRRIIWPTEAMFMIEGLSHIGDFGDYIEPVFRTYFQHMQLPTGEIGALGIYWASITAAVLYSFARYCQLSAGPEFFDQYRDHAYRAFRFIKELRRSVTDSQELAGGLFPILRGIDWAQQFQCWTSTDVFNVLGLDALAELFAARKDPAAPELRQEHQEYLADMKRHFRKYYDACTGDTLRIPLKPMGDDADLVKDFYPLLYHGRFIYCGIIDKEADIRRVYNFMLQNGITREGLGLYGHMPYRSGNQNVWYLSFPDYYWFEIWRKLGHRERAKQVLDAQLRYGMTEEYCFTERIDSTDVYYTPWAPNASATGRAFTMLCEYYAE